jgi:hypothetical protein
VIKIIKKIFPLLLVLIIYNSCKDNGPTSPSPGPVRTPDWIPNQITQPVPSWGSTNRLILPVGVNQIVLGPGAGIGGFGAHEGGHPEGLDHVWLEVKPGIPIRSWAGGKVTKIENTGSEYFITIEYDGGLVGKHMEVKTCLVSVGQHVNAGDPVCYGLGNGIFQSAEFMLTDFNRNDGVTLGGPDGATGSYVSPFDYLRSDLKDSLEQKYIREVINPYLSKGLDAGNNLRVEPYLTNRVLFHKLYKGTIAGEWIKNSKWGQGPYHDVLVFQDVNNPYFTGKKIIAADNFTDFNNYIDGPWTADTSVHHVTFTTQGTTYYGLYELNESGSRATLKIEYRTDTYPNNFSSNAAVYIERSNLPKAVDAQQLGVY